MIKSRRKTIATHEEMLDRFIGKRGTAKREKFEFDIELTTVGHLIRQLRLRQGLTQDDLGQLIGVQKAQISKLEKDGSNMTIGTLVRVFTALRAKFKVELTR